MSKKKIVNLKKLNRKDVTVDVDGTKYTVTDMTLDLEFDFDGYYSTLVGKIDWVKSMEDDSGLSAWSDIMDNTTKSEMKEMGLFALENIKGCEDLSIMDAFTVLYVFCLEFANLKAELKKK